MPFEAKRKNLEDIMFSETDRERKTLYDLSYMWNLNNKANKREEKKTHRYREWVVAKGSGTGGLG